MAEAEALSADKIESVRKQMVSEINNLLQPINNNLTLSNNEKLDKRLQAIVDYVNAQDFSFPEKRAAALSQAKNLADDITKDKTISPIQMIAAYSMLAKLSLAERGLVEIKIKFGHKNDKTNFTAFYNPIDNSTNFLYEVVCSPSMLQSSIITGINKSLRLEYFCNNVMVQEHEIQHGMREKIRKNTPPQNMDTETYIISIQTLARCLSQQGKKYQTQNEPNSNVDKLYHINHNEFWMELDADKTGYSRALDRLKQISENAYDVAKNNLGFERRIAELSDSLEHYDKVTWNHDTNPNHGPVTAMHKTMQIIDEVLPKLDSAQKNQLFSNYPELGLTYKIDGSKKTLQEVEAERDQKIADLSDKEKIEQLSNLYGVIIEGDAVYSFERALDTIKALNISKPEESKQMFEQLKLSTAKAKQLASYLENQNSKIAQKLFKSAYHHVLHKSIENTPENRRLNQDKRHAIYDISSVMHFKNEELAEGISEVSKLDIKQRDAKEKAKSEALETLKKAFPGFAPTPKMLEGNEIGLVSKNNETEKIRLLQSITQYNKDGRKFANGEEVLKIADLQKAVNILYDFSVPENVRTEFDYNLMNGDETLIPNAFSQKNTSIQKNVDSGEPTITRVSKEEIETCRDENPELREPKPTIQIDKRQKIQEQSTATNESEMEEAIAMQRKYE